MKTYAKQMGASQEVLDWINTTLEAYLVKHKPSISEQEHIIDYLCSDEAPQRLRKMSYEQAKKGAEKWTKALQKKGASIKETKKDTEVVLDFKDGFKIVRLVGKNAYKREGFLMRHCVESFFEKDDEIYSLRDSKNMPHCTMSKSSQQIKGKGNGAIHPKYIGYVVEFLEFAGIEVRDSEMENLGYVNIEDIQDKNTIFPKEYIFRKKYYLKEAYDKIVDKKGNRYHNLTLWDKFGLFTFTASMKVKMHFDLNKCIDSFTKLFKKNKKDYNEIAATDYNEIAVTDYNKIAVTDYNRIAATYNNKIAAANGNEIAATNDNKIAAAYNNKIAAAYDNEVAVTYDNEIAVTYSNKIAATNYNEIAATNDNKIAATNNNKIAVACNNKIAVTYDNEIAAARSSKIAAANYNEIAAANYNEIAATNDNKIAVTDNNEIKLTDSNNVVAGVENIIKCEKHNVICAGNESKVKGKKGTLIVLYERNDKEEIINHKTKLIDGVKIKEDTWYTLKNGRFTQVTK